VKTALAMAEPDDDGSGWRLGRYHEILRRMAHASLPPTVPRLMDTDDIVQRVLAQVARHTKTFEFRNEGAFLAYLRRVLHNIILGRGIGETFTPPLLGGGRTERDRTRYSLALEMLPEPAHLAVLMRLEMGLTYKEIAQAILLPSAGAARMAVVQGYMRLSSLMSEGRDS